ncbi:hypothetical protein ALC56_01218 [Trachymyrmex septentrionalis]|uniref:Testicular haploid expressed protein n=2 Tax=Trachymyrmex septentrionalis TaxID=34720 RepID=A0A151K0S0_9HYME|nr:hypothetical protein ALC56_01218 [Trachymyrmex septentrionalis]
MKLAPTKNMKAFVGDLLVKVRKSRYQRYRVFSSARQAREARKKRKLMAKLRRALTKPEDWQRHMRALEILAAPKARPKRRKPIKKRKWRPVDMERVSFLALPLIRHEPTPRDPFRVSERALVYRMSKRMERLTYLTIRPEIEYRIPGRVSPAATKAIASKRVIALAKPAKRPTGRETDLREDAFTVSPMALKARCSKRLKNLAKPKIYPKPVFKRLKTALKR